MNEKYINNALTQCLARSTPASLLRYDKDSGLFEGNGILHGKGAPGGRCPPNDGVRLNLLEEHFKARAKRPRAEEQLPDATLSMNEYIAWQARGKTAGFACAAG